MVQILILRVFFKGDIMSYVTVLFGCPACVCVCSNDVLLHNCNWRPDDPNV